MKEIKSEVVMRGALLAEWAGRPRGESRRAARRGTAVVTSVITGTSGGTHGRATEGT